MLEVAWHALAQVATAADVDRLLDAPWPSTWRAVLARVEVLARLMPDPRIALVIARVARGFASQWTGPLPGVRSRVFERGFLVHLEIDAPGELLAQAIDRPEWTTLEVRWVDAPLPIE